MMARKVNAFLKPVLLRRNGAAWEYAAMGGNTDWRPLEGSEGLTEPEAVEHTMDRIGHLVDRMPEADVESIDDPHYFVSFAPVKTEQKGVFLHRTRCKCGWQSTTHPTARSARDEIIKHRETVGA